jgi:hypothetical protein
MKENKVRLPSFAYAENLEIKKDPEPEPLPDGISAHDLLRLVYQGKVKITSQQMRAAEAALPYESPKLSAVAHVTDLDKFAVQLELAIERSARSQGRLIEAKVEPSPEEP